MSSQIYPVILCGGSGTRLWPLSRQSYPKQFSPFFGDESLFQASVSRVSGPGYAAPLIMTAGPFRFIVAEQLAALGLDASAIILEPDGRNTAPAVITAALYLAQNDPAALMLIAPSDHIIRDKAAFQDAIAAGGTAAQAGQLVTFGITPDRAETGYGYLELEHPFDADNAGPQPLQRFVEKPDAETAKTLCASGRFLWNAGIFLFSVQSILAAYAAYCPDILEACRRAMAGAKPDLGFLRPDAGAWAEARNISLDYAVMEAAQNLSVVPMQANWSDLGAWDAVWRETPPDPAGVALSGPATSIDCKNSLLRAEDPEQELVGIGLEHIAAIAMRDAVLVADMRRTQDVRQAVARLKAKPAPQATDFPRVHRPWGWYETLTKGERFQVKRIVVRPGGALSLQSHIHRAEHWIVVRGTARVTVEQDVSLLSENQSTYIPLGKPHRLENPGKVELHLIEVQSGSYLGEDDIIRYEDAYSRD